MLNSKFTKILAISALATSFFIPPAFASGSHSGGHKAMKSDDHMRKQKAGTTDNAKPTENKYENVTTPLSKLNGKDSTKLTNRLVVPKMDPLRGKKLFVSKGCVACHSINGIGGHDAPKLDAHTMDKTMNPFDFAAKMWRAAPAMISTQEEAFGEQIYFTGDELADLAAFVHDDDVQHTFKDSDLTPQAHKMMDHSHGGGKTSDGHKSN
jgi:cytochrome c